MTMVAYLLVLFAVVFRLVTEASALNFAPVAAALLFFGSRMPRRQAWVPVAALIASDLVLTTRVYGYPLRADQIVIWAWYLAIVLLGSLLAGHTKNAWRIAGASLAASISFFLLSNFAVWAAWEMYPRTFQGLLACYTAAIPFFRNTAASDMLFTAAFFGIPAVVESLRTKAACKTLSV
jgi:hypothetical protein